MRGADFVRGSLLDTLISRSCLGVVGREFPADLVICVARGGGANEVLNSTGFGLTDGFEVEAKSFGSGIAAEVGRARRVSDDVCAWREGTGCGGRGEDRFGDAGFGSRQFGGGIRSDEWVFCGDLLTIAGSSPELDRISGSRRKEGSCAAICRDEASAASFAFFSLADGDR